MTNIEFVEKAIWIAGLKTQYAVGAFGAPCSAYNKSRYGNKPQNKPYKSKIDNASADTFMFDCVGLIKGILWGFEAKKNTSYGGATYTKSGIPDFGTESLPRMKGYHKGLDDIPVGAILYMKGHAGIYIGNHQVIEATPAWRGCVQWTYSDKKFGNAQKWEGWVKLPYLDYEDEEMKQEDFNKMMDVWLAERMAMPASDYAKEPLKWAKDKKIMQGDEKGNQMPKAFITREDVITILHRALN